MIKILAFCSVLYSEIGVQKNALNCFRKPSFCTPYWLESYFCGLPRGSVERIPLPMQETQEIQVQTLCQEDPLLGVMTTHSSILAWKIPWTEEPDGLQSMGLQIAGLNWGNEHMCTYISVYFILICSVQWLEILDIMVQLAELRVWLVANGNSS